jgi:2-keto-4-pentenoate hydratase/2-oxohepta-3-ene-1,7-dioic acid hydratase in catechol pathway
LKIASFVANARRSFGIVQEDMVVDIGQLVSKGDAYLRDAITSQSLNNLAKRSKEAPTLKAQEVAWLPVIPNPDKILCIGLNYESHRLETGRAEVKYPTVFLRLPNTQIAQGANLCRPKLSIDFDFEGELALVIGRHGRHILPEDAYAHVAGYACYNDATVRDWQRHTHQFTPGKNFPGTGAFGPYLVTADEIPDITSLKLTTRLNGNVMQRGGLDELIFPIPQLIAYCSAFTPLEPGDVICTGTPGGVGFKRTPPIFMKAGDTIEVEITELGTLRNGVEDEAA